MFSRKANRMHLVWWDFQRRFINKKGKFTKLGYPLMKAVERWAAKYPMDVEICTVDDSYHAGSALVLVQHRMSPRKVWGVSVVYIPQCTGESPISFFLYPSHYRELAPALARIRWEKEPY